MQHLRTVLPPWLHDWLDVIVPLAQVIAIVALAWLLQRMVRRVLSRLAQRYQLPAAVITPARNLLRWLIYGIATLWVLERLGVSSDVLWAGLTGYSPFRMCTSVPQMVVVVMRISASLGPTSGMGLSTISMRPFSMKAAAFIIFAVLMRYDSPGWVT